MAMAADSVPPPPPNNLTASPLSGGFIELRWRKASGENLTFKIYRSLTADPDSLTLIGAANGTVFLDTDTLNGKEYHYIVRAVDTAGNEELNKAMVSATASKGGPRILLAFGLITALILGAYTVDQQRGAAEAA